jgi:Tol biopolymer transport system component/tRNA A-37 threonylcarbamoyl transferase component Bud32
MPLAAGTRLGVFEILAPLGAGGMGEVYRARDPKLNRDVAIKILPEALAADPAALARFEREAQAVAALSHPNILSIHDFGVEQGAPYAVMELLEGQTLREHLREGAVPRRKAVSYALQIAAGLAAAHARGITHRDLKPENVFVTRDGQVKILDFGLAKPRPDAASGASVALTGRVDTTPGTVLGTAGYMAPEQVRGQEVDHRADIFALGAVLYELLAGRRAFQGTTPADTMSAILKEDPPELTTTATGPVAPALDRIVRRCLEKNPDERFQSARDVAFALEAISGAGSDSGLAAALPAPAAAIRLSRARLGLIAAVAIAFVGAAVVGAYLAGARATGWGVPHVARLTFDRGTLRTARFTPDGRTVVYGAAWNGEPLAVFQTRLGSPESSRLPLPAGDVLAVSSSGEMAISVGQRFNNHVGDGTLARTPPVGSSYKEVLEHVTYADWSPDGKTLAVVTRVGGKVRLEYPMGHVLYETTGYISHPRVSPSGDAIAFLDHPVYDDNRGTVALVTLNGEKKTLTREWAGEYGLAWAPGGDEIWFTAGDSERQPLSAVTRAGRLREVWSPLASVILFDIAPDGRVLLAAITERMESYWLGPGDAGEREISWMSLSVPRDVAANGRSVLLTRYDEGAGRDYEVGLRRLDEPSAVRLGPGEAVQLSPDGTRALAIVYSAPRQLLVHPTGVGETRRLTAAGFDYLGAGWHPDGRRVVFVAERQGQPLSAYIQDAAGDAPTRLGIELDRLAVRIRSWTSLLMSPDGKWFTGRGGPPTLVALDGNQTRTLPTLGDSDVPIGWTADGRGLFVRRDGSTDRAVQIARVDLASGAIEPFREIVLRDRVGLTTRPNCLVTPDGRTVVYSTRRVLTDLYLVEGLK